MNRVPADYLGAPERRSALYKWLQHKYGNGGTFTAAEIQVGAVDIFTPLYATGISALRQVGSDLNTLRKEGKVRMSIGHGQWKLC